MQDRRVSIMVEGNNCPRAGGKGCGMEALEQRVNGLGGILPGYKGLLFHTAEGDRVVVCEAFDLPDGWEDGSGIACATQCVTGHGEGCGKDGGILVYGNPTVQTQ